MKRFLVAGGVLLVILAGALAPRGARAQIQEPTVRSENLIHEFRTIPNITYLTANNFDAKLDVYRPAAEGFHATLVYIHGGGWVNGSKEQTVLDLIPYLEHGWAVVNVEYRLARVSLAPAAVEDCRCALRWVIQHAKENGFDTNRIVVSGGSAGGHLALMTGMLTPVAGLDRECPGSEDLKVAAIVDWFGITDVNDLLDGADMRAYAVAWLGSQPDREQIAKRVSPLTYVRPGLPPILMIQGDADPTVPYSHSVRLKKALDDAGVPNELLTIPGGKHGGFSGPEMGTAFAHVWAFLAKYLPKGAS